MVRVMNFNTVNFPTFRGPPYALNNDSSLNEVKSFDTYMLMVNFDKIMGHAGSCGCLFPPKDKKPKRLGSIDQLGTKR